MRRQLVSILLLTALACTACSSTGDASEAEPTVIGQATVVAGDVEPGDVVATFDGFTWCIRFAHSPPACNHQITAADDGPGVKDLGVSGTGEGGRVCSSTAASTEVVALELSAADIPAVELDPIVPTIGDSRADFHVFAWCATADEMRQVQTQPVLASGR